MKVRLLIVNPQITGEPPIAPTLVYEREGQVYVYSTEWAFPVAQKCLADVTVSDMDSRLRFRDEDTVYLSEIRELPSGELMSESILFHLRAWWLEEVAALQEKVLAKAS